MKTSVRKLMSGLKRAEAGWHETLGTRLRGEGGNYSSSLPLSLPMGMIKGTRDVMAKQLQRQRKNYGAKSTRNSYKAGG